MSKKITLWGGRFQGAPAKTLATSSVFAHFGWRLADYDLQGSLTCAKAPHEAELLTGNEYLALTAVLEHLRQDVASGAFACSPEDEDVHTALERGLLEGKYVGEELGGKLRAERSRNDRIATLIRIYLRDATSHSGK